MLIVLLAAAAGGLGYWIFFRIDPGSDIVGHWATQSSTYINPDKSETVIPCTPVLKNCFEIDFRADKSYTFVLNGVSYNGTYTYDKKLEAVQNEHGRENRLLIEFIGKGMITVRPSAGPPNVFFTLVRTGDDLPAPLNAANHQPDNKAETEEPKEPAADQASPALPGKPPKLSFTEIRDRFNQTLLSEVLSASSMFEGYDADNTTALDWIKKEYAGSKITSTVSGDSADPDLVYLSFDISDKESGVFTETVQFNYNRSTDRFEFASAYAGD